MSVPHCLRQRHPGFDKWSQTCTIQVGERRLGHFFFLNNISDVKKIISL